MSVSKYKIHSKIVFLLGFFMVQTKIILGINTSFSDLFMVVIAMLYILNNNFFIDKKYLLFNIAILMLSLVSTLLSATKFKLDIDSYFFISNLIKVIINFIYFQLGYNLFKKNQFKNFKKGIIFSSTLVSIIALSNYLIKSQYLTETMFYSGIRMKGLMNDPNYFAIMQLVGLSFLMNTESDYKKKKIFIPIIILSVFASGSKTGTIVLSIFLTYKYIKLFYRKIKSNKYVLLHFLIFIGIGFLIFKFNVFSFFISFLENYIPSLSRVVLVFEDLGEAITSGGSGRALTWETAYKIFRTSPLIGVGIGMYSKISMSEYGVRSIAHNSYLQALSEWGVVVFIVFIVLIFNDLVRTKNSREKRNTITDSLIVLALGSISISLNNSRILWILLGMLRALSTKEDLNELY